VWAIALRCALLSGYRATLYAGAGIVGDSVPADELDETGRKFRAFLDALRWG
jgi:isochorismate synthase EntC